MTLNSFTIRVPMISPCLLVGPSGANSILMGNVGGCDDTGVINLTFDQSAAAALNATDTATSGTYRPSDDRARWTRSAPRRRAAHTP